MASTFDLLVGAMPAPQTLAFIRWIKKLIRLRLAEIPLARTTTYFFSQAGNDTTGNGSQATPWRTIAKANEIINASSGNIRLRFNRGDIWRETTGLLVNKANVTIDDYGSGQLQKPRFSAFQLYGTGWTATAGRINVWQISEATKVAWFREANDVVNVPYRKMTSVAQVESTRGSWWWESGTNTLYVHTKAEAAVAPSSDVRGYERVYDSLVDGIQVTNVDGCRIENIRCDGYGANATSGAAASWYGIKAICEGTNAVVVKDCEAYYNGKHSMGQVAGGSGGISTWIGNKTGWCTSLGADASVTVATNHVAYAAAGQQEAIWVSNVHVGGDVFQRGSTYSSGSSNGSGIYAHTSGGANRSKLLIAYKNQTAPGQNQVGLATSFADTPSWTDPIDCRSFVIGEVFSTRDLSPLDATNPVAYAVVNPGGLGALNTCVINSYIEGNVVGDTSPNNDRQWLSGANGWWWNCIVFYRQDVLGTPPNAAIRGRILFTNGATALWRLWHSRIHMLMNGSNLRMHLATTAGVYGGTIVNSILSADLSSNNTFELRATNAAATLTNNCYSNVTTKTGTGGYDADPSPVESGDLPLKYIPQAQSDLINTAALGQLIAGRRLEYDMFERARDNQRTAIGPIEYDYDSLDPILSDAMEQVVRIAIANASVTQRIDSNTKLIPALL